MDTRTLAVLAGVAVFLVFGTVHGQSDEDAQGDGTFAVSMDHDMDEEQKESSDVDKRIAPALIPFLGIIGSALGIAGNVGITMYNNIDKRTCGIIIVWAQPRGRPGVNINFMSVSENNWNHERLDTDRNVYHADSTTERVDGGPLKMVQFWWDQGTAACVKSISFACGESVLGGKKVAVFDEATFTRRAQKQGKVLHYIHNYQGQGTCVWFSHNPNNIRAVDFYPGMFSCGPDDSECKANNIQIFVN